MRTETKNQLRVQLTVTLLKFIERAYERGFDVSEFPHISNELTAQMAEAALIPLFACADLESHLLSVGLLEG